MTWFKVDDHFATHPKFIRCDLAARGLWVTMGAWCSDQLTDGKMPREAVALFDPDGAATAQLLAVGLWVETGDGYAFHDWADYQPSAKALKAKKKKRSEAGSRGAAKRWQNDGKAIANGWQNDSKRMANSCPEPEPEPEPVGTHKGGLGSDLADAALAALSARPELAPVATQDMAQSLAMTAHDHGKAPSDVTAALTELAGKVRAGLAVGEDWSTSRLAAAADGFVRAHRHRPGQGPQSAPDLAVRAPSRAVSRLRPVGGGRA